MQIASRVVSRSTFNIFNFRSKYQPIRKDLAKSNNVHMRDERSPTNTHEKPVTIGLKRPLTKNLIMRYITLVKKSGINGWDCITKRLISSKV